MSILSKLEQNKWYKVVFLITIPIFGVIVGYFTIYSVFIAQHKELSFKDGPFIPITNLDVVADKRIKVLYDNKSVGNITVKTIQFINTGNVAIDNSDFKAPLKLELDKPSKILNASTFDVSNNDLAKELKAKLTFDDSNVYISDVFLNPNDSFSINLLISNLHGTVYLTHRIKDITGFVDVNTNSRSKQSKVIFLVFSFLMIILIVFLIYIIRLRKEAKLLSEKTREEINSLLEQIKKEH